MKKIFFLMTAAGTLCLLAADKIQPLQAKLGLWEVTTTMQMRGAPPIPPEVFAKMTPAQREQMEAAIKQSMAGGTPQTQQSCMTPDKLTQPPFSGDSKSCQRTILNSTPKLLQFHEECTEPNGSKRTVDAKFEFSDDKNMKGSAVGKSMNNGKPTTFSIDVASKWLGSDCGAMKNQ